MSVCASCMRRCVEYVCVQFAICVQFMYACMYMHVCAYDAPLCMACVCVIFMSHMHMCLYVCSFDMHLPLALVGDLHARLDSIQWMRDETCDQTPGHRSTHPRHLPGR